MSTDEESSDISSLEEGFPFCVDVDRVNSRQGFIRLTNKRDRPITFKCLLQNHPETDPESFTITPSIGKLDGKETISICVHLNKHGASECGIKLLVRFADPRAGDGCPRLMFWNSDPRMFEKTVRMNFEKVRLSEQLKTLCGYFECKARKIPFRQCRLSLPSSVLILLLGIICVCGVVHVTRGLFCPKPGTPTLAGYMTVCRIPFVGQYLEGCMPNWREVLQSRFCDM